MRILSFINEKRKAILRKEIYLEIKKINPRKILDNGCGRNGSFDYKEFSNRITRADILHGIDCEALPYKDNSFDCVIFAGVIQYVLDPKRAMKECYRVLKKDGILIISTINTNSLIKKIKGFGKEEKRSFTSQGFKNFIETFNFSVEKVKYLDFWFIPNKSKLILYCKCKKKK
jgi:2-polyprenyl-3-methyl-5-hydroxy-6-metoxy-1,4-benzoquinol methylase